MRQNGKNKQTNVVREKWAKFMEERDEVMNGIRVKYEGIYIIHI